MTAIIQRAKSLATLFLALALFQLTIFTPRVVRAEPMREFVMSCSYGVLAGTIVGAATLAFSNQPGENLHKVARGASIGLYAGILLGFYVIYGVPGPGEEDEPTEEDLSVLRGASRGRHQGVYHLTHLARSARAAEKQPQVIEPRIMIHPLISRNEGIEGAALKLNVLRF